MRIASKKEILQKYSSIMRGDKQGETYPTINEQLKSADRLLEILSSEHKDKEKSVVIIDDITDARLENLKQLMRQNEE